MKKTTLYFGVGFLLIGLYLFFNPLVSIASIAWVIALVIASMGFMNLCTYQSLEKNDKNNWLLVQSLVKIIIGLILLTSSAFSLSSIVMSFIGLGLLIIGAINFKISNFSNKKILNKTHTTGSLIFTFLLGIIFLLNPTFSAGVIGYFLSLVLMIIGAIILLIYYQSQT